MAAETELRELIASRREGVLGTIKRGGLPQLSNILYLPDPGGRTVRISTTADRLKARVLARDPRAVLHVTGDNFWAYAVGEGHATLTSAAADAGDEACRQLLEVHSAFYGPQDQDAFFTEMIARRRLVIRLSLDRVYGVIATGGRRPLPVSGSAPRLPGRSDAAAGRVRLAGGQPGQQVAEQPLLLRTERGEQLGLRSIALGGHLALDGVAGSRQQRDAGAPVTARRGRG